MSISKLDELKYHLNKIFIKLLIPKRLKLEAQVNILKFKLNKWEIALINSNSIINNLRAELNNENAMLNILKAELNNEKNNEKFVLIIQNNSIAKINCWTGEIQKAKYWR